MGFACEADSIAMLNVPVSCNAQRGAVYLMDEFLVDEHTLVSANLPSEPRIQPSNVAR